MTLFSSLSIQHLIELVYPGSDIERLGESHIRLYLKDIDTTFHVRDMETLEKIVKLYRGDLITSPPYSDILGYKGI